MARLIPEATIDELRSNVNILDIISQYVQLHKSGKNWFGICPFRSEKTPSFSVNEQKQIFHCFSCHRGGNVFKFIMELEGLSFPESVQRVAELANYDLGISIDNSENQNETSENGKIRKLYKETTKLYHHILVNTVLGEPALEYLHKRGINDDLIEEFEIGFAPENNILEAFFKEQKLYDYQILRKSGLFIERQSTELVERFNGRVMFPIRDTSGQTIAYSGRLLEKRDDAPKYLNSPETAIFNKRKVLFNFDKAKGIIRREKEAILFEGFMDVIAAYRSGIKNGISSMGTSLTDEQIYALDRVTSHLVICYDGDNAGQNATKRALEIIEPTGKFSLEVIKIPEKLDPDEFTKKYGSEKFVELARNDRKSPLEFYLSYYEQDKNLNNENDQLEYIRDILQEIAKVRDPLEQDLYLNRLAQRFNVAKENLDSQLKQIREKIFAQRAEKQEEQSYQAQQIPRTVIQKNEVQHFSKSEKAERLLLYRMLHDKNVWLRINGIPDFNFIHENYQVIYNLSEAYFDTHDEYEVADFLDFINEDGLRQVVVTLEMGDYADEVSEQEINDCLSLIMSQTPLEDKIKKVQTEMLEAKRQNDTAKITKLTMDLISLLKEQQNAKSLTI